VDGLLISGSRLLWLEQVNNTAVYLGAIAYGVTIAVYFICVYYLRVNKTRGNWRWLVFVTVLFALATVNIALNIRFAQAVYILNRGYPGGPLAYLLEQQAVPTNIAGNAEAVVIAFLSDGLLIYRCFVVYRRWWVIVIPILMWLSSIALLVLFNLQAALPNSSLWANSTLNYSVPYFSVVMALNILLTLLLVGRLLYMRHKISKALGSQHGRTYTHVATMLLESAAPYGIISFIFIVLYGKNNIAANLFIPLWVQLGTIAPIFIVLRVTRGYAWSNETISEGALSDIRIGKGSAGSTTAANGSRSNGSNTTTMAFKAASNPHLHTKESDFGLTSHV